MIEQQEWYVEGPCGLNQIGIGPSIGCVYGAGEQVQEHARLVSAAPDLLAALSQMLTHMGMDEDEWNAGTFKQARAAIAKATGAAA